MAKKIKKRRLNIKRTFACFLMLYIFCYALYYLVNRPIRHFEIIGNEYITDSEILKQAKLKDYPAFFKYTNKSIEKKIEGLELVDEVNVKKGLNFTIKIKIKENKPLFYYNNKLVLSNGDIIENKYNNIYGIPTLINDTNKEILKKFIEKFKNINDNIIYEINEIEYYPQITEENIVVDEDRFRVFMNDGNTVVTKIKTINVLNKYNDIYASLGNKKGVISLDTNEINNLVFIPYEE